MWREAREAGYSEHEIAALLPRFEPSRPRDAVSVVHLRSALILVGIPLLASAPFLGAFPVPNAVAATAVLLGMCPLAWLVVALPAFHPLLVTIDDCTVRVFLGRRRLLRMAGPDRARPERRRKPLLRIVGWSVSAALPLGLAALYSVTGHLHLIGPTVGWIAIMLIVIAAALALVPRSVFHLVILRPGVEPLHPRVAAVLLVDYLVRGGDPGRLGTGITLGELRVPATFVDGTATTEFS